MAARAACPRTPAWIVVAAASRAMASTMVSSVKAKAACP
jgi:hypothetical protein